MPGSGQDSDAWKDNASHFERVQSVSQTVLKPRTASWIVSEAEVPKSTARRYLDRLVEMNVLSVITNTETTKYAPDPLYVRLHAIRELLDEHEHEDLVALRQDLEAQVEKWQKKHEVQSPESLRDIADDASTANETAEIRRTVNEWELTEYRLGVLNNAIESYRKEDSS